MFFFKDSMDSLIGPSTNDGKRAKYYAGLDFLAQHLESNPPVEDRDKRDFYDLICTFADYYYLEKDFADAIIEMVTIDSERGEDGLPPLWDSAALMKFVREQTREDIEFDYDKTEEFSILKAMVCERIADDIAQRGANLRPALRDLQFEITGIQCMADMIALLNTKLVSYKERCEEIIAARASGSTAQDECERGDYLQLADLIRTYELHITTLYNFHTI